MARSLAGARLGVGGPDPLHARLSGGAGGFKAGNKYGSEEGEAWQPVPVHERVSEVRIRRIIRYDLRKYPKPRAAPKDGAGRKMRKLGGMQEL